MTEYPTLDGASVEVTDEDERQFFLRTPTGTFDITNSVLAYHRLPNGRVRMTMTFKMSTQECEICGTTTGLHTDELCFK